VQQIRLRRCRDKQALKRTEKSYHLINLVLDDAYFLLAFVNPIKLVLDAAYFLLAFVTLIFQRRTKVVKVPRTLLSTN
jgi:hypothetical protein